jgi:hypothetical protein
MKMRIRLPRATVSRSPVRSCSNHYGNTPPRWAILKGAEDTVTTHFMKRVYDIMMIRDGLSDRTIVMQKARQENEAEFEIFQLV